MGSKVITVFEHDTLYLNEEFNQNHYNALVKLNDVHGKKYFSPGYRQIRFNSHVGVIQAGSLVIEILPKADNLPAHSLQTKVKWQKALLYMLRKSGYIKINDNKKAMQGQQYSSLLDIYLYAFLQEVDFLVHAGLVKKYRRKQHNSTVLKGRLLLDEQVVHNSIHKERFFTDHIVYDRNNLFNGILKMALEIIAGASSNYSIKRIAWKLLLNFEEVVSWKGNAKNLDVLVFDRKTDGYKYAINLAKMIILNYSPDMSSGNKSLLAILFDMNQLFEKFIYRTLKKEEANFPGLTIKPQSVYQFWKGRVLKPDMVLEYNTTDAQGNNLVRTIVIDTKWKIIEGDKPSLNDLRQMYAYNIQIGSQRSILFYPSIGQINSGSAFYEKCTISLDFSHSCELYFAELFQHNVIDETFPAKFIKYLLDF